MTKQEILNYLDNVLHPIVSPDNWNVYSELHDMIEELPSAEPVRHGKWECTYSPNGFLLEQTCSECGLTFEEPSGVDYNYCPRCGARIDGE